MKVFFLIWKIAINKQILIIGTKSYFEIFNKNDQNSNKKNNNNNGGLFIKLNWVSAKNYNIAKKNEKSYQYILLDVICAITNRQLKIKINRLNLQ